MPEYTAILTIIDALQVPILNGFFDYVFSKNLRVSYALHFSDKPFSPVVELPANGSVIVEVEAGTVLVGACRPPSVAIEPEGARFRCSNI